MENDIDTRYNDLSDSDYIMQRNHIQPNHLCMAKYSTVWHRGIITRVYEDHVKVIQIFFIKSIENLYEFFADTIH